MGDKKYTLECNGIQLKTNYWMPISDEEYAKVRHDYFDLPPFEELVSNGYCWDYAIGNEIGHIFIRNEEVNLEFRDDILPFEDDN